MHILITGGTGFIGQELIKQLKSRYKFTVLTRNPQQAFAKLGHDISCINDLNQLRDLNNFQAVINLAGEPIADKRWSSAQKNEILTSRVQITKQLATLFQQSSSPPKAFISGSAIGYYGRQNPCEKITESYTQPHNEFTHNICKEWESAAQAVSSLTRLCIVRTGIVLGKQGGALKKMLPAFKCGLGGKLATGEQIMSWIHIDDMVESIIHLLHNENSSGIYNLTAPCPVSNAEFSQIFADSLQRPYWFHTPAWLLNIMLGEMAEILTTGQYVVPQKLLDEGFEFRFHELSEAMHNINHKQAKCHAI